MQAAENRTFKFQKGILTITFKNTFTEHKDIQIIFHSELRKVVKNSSKALKQENTSKKAFRHQALHSDRRGVGFARKSSIKTGRLDKSFAAGRSKVPGDSDNCSRVIVGARTSPFTKKGTSQSQGKEERNQYILNLVRHAFKVQKQ